MTTKSTDIVDGAPNCFIVNCARTEKMACFANSLWEMEMNASDRFNKGPLAGKIVLERNGKLVNTEKEFLDLLVDDTFMYVNFSEKWEEAPPNVVEKLEAKLFYRRPEPATPPRRVSKKIVELYRKLVANNAFETDEAWEKLDGNIVEDIWMADLEIVEQLVKAGNKGILKLIKDKAWKIYCKRPYIKGEHGWSFPDEDEDDFVTLADLTSSNSSETGF